MTTPALFDLSEQLADAVAAVQAGVVQVHGGRRPVSGLVYADDIVITTMRGVGRGDAIQVRRADGEVLDAELVGWDPATTLAVVRAKGLQAAALTPGSREPRVGNLAIAVARSWSNFVTASAGIISVIGGPLRTSRRRAIDQVIRTTAPMHEGFSGGGFFDAGGTLIGVATALTIRGLGVVIPASIAWKAAATVIEHEGVKRGFLGLAGQPVALPKAQQPAGETRERALLVVGLTADGPAAAAGVLVGDVVLALDGQPIEAPEELLDLLAGQKVGQSVSLTVLRGGTVLQLPVTVGERPTW